MQRDQCSQLYDDILNPDLSEKLYQAEEVFKLLSVSIQGMMKMLTTFFQPIVSGFDISINTFLLMHSRIIDLVL